MVSFNMPREDALIVNDIARRAVMAAARAGVRDTTFMEWSMDIAATHANGCPLRLYELRDADDFNFNHDVFGIRRHIDRKTGKLSGCFVPRFAR